MPNPCVSSIWRNSAHQECVCLYTYLHVYINVMYIKRQDGGNEEQETRKIPWHLHTVKTIGH